MSATYDAAAAAALNLAKGIAFDVERFNADYDAPQLVWAYNVLAGNGQERHAEALLAARPGIVNFDEHGNWIGVVANENGWTP